MKYTSKKPPLVCMQTQSTCYKGTRKMTIKGILWHSTGVNNNTIKRYVQPSNSKPSADTYNKAKWLQILGKNSYGNDWNHIYVEAGLNAWIGCLADGSVTTIQTMPWEYRPWGCGSGSKGSCNDGWIQFEICEDNLSNKTYFDKVYKEACELTAYLCKKYNLDPKGYTTHNGVKVPVILCHADSYRLGLGSGHADVMHWFKKHGKTMATVRKDVAALMKGTTKEDTTSKTTTTSSTNKSTSSSKKTESVSKDTQSTVNVTYKVKAGGKWLSEVVNLKDYAGIEGKAITDIAIKVSKGTVKYRVHVLGGKWLPYVTGYNTKDYNNGYAGNGKAIDAIEIIYSGTKKAYYKVSPINTSSYYSYQSDNDKGSNLDGYAGVFGKKIDKLQIYIK